MNDQPIVHLTVDGHRPRVAIVGGSPASTMIATILVEQFGCEPLATAGGEAVLALLRRDRAIDLILLDPAFADIDGIVTAQLIRGLDGRSALPIIAVTDGEQHLAAADPPAAGFVGTLMKPYSPRELYAAMEAALAHDGAAPMVVGHA